MYIPIIPCVPIIQHIVDARTKTKFKEKDEPIFVPAQCIQSYLCSTRKAKERRKEKISDEIKTHVYEYRVSSPSLSLRLSRRRLRPSRRYPFVKPGIG